MSVRTERAGGTRRAEVVGRFDGHEVTQAQGLLRELVEGDAPVLEVDLSGVTFVDSSALAELVALRRTPLARGGSFTLTGASEPVRTILEVTDLAAVLLPDAG